MPTTVTDIAAARQTCQQREAGERDIRRVLLEVQEQAARARRNGSPAAEIARLDFKLARTRAKVTEAQTALRDAVEQLRLRRTEFTVQSTPDDRVSHLVTSCPIALLPVRIETRYLADRRQLCIRIYPDQIHIDQHDPALTQDERDAAAIYASAAAAGKQAGERAWQGLVATFGPQRAGWIATASGNLAAIPTRAPGQRTTPRAVGLPEQWLAILYRAGQVVHRQWAPNPVTEQLSVGAFDPNASEDSSDPADAPLSSDLRWQIDYDQAIAKGMAITIDNVMAGARYDRLVVLGVDTTRDANANASSLNDLLHAHAYTDGCALVSPGTPTNATAQAKAAALAPAQPGTRSSSHQAATALLTTLRLPAGGWLSELPGADTFESDGTGALLRALWPATAGYYLSQIMAPMATETLSEEVREFAGHYLRPTGCAPTLRIGQQPYGILPVLRPPVQAETDDSLETRLSHWLRRLRKPWMGSLDQVPRLAVPPGATPEALARKIEFVLKQTPQSATVQFRRVLSATTVANSTYPTEVHTLQQRLSDILRQHLQWATEPRAASMALEPAAYALPLTFSPPDAAYVRELSSLCVLPTAREQLLKKAKRIQRGGSLIEALLVLGALNAFDTSLRRILAPYADQSPWNSAERLEHDGLLNIVPERVVGLPIATMSDANRVVLQPLGLAPVGSLVGPAVGKYPNTPHAEAVKPLWQYRDALSQLARVGKPQLKEAAPACLDVFSHRLDAWFTALAYSRLTSMQRLPAGIHLGGYGWLEDVVCGNPDSPEDGFMLVPSLAHAAAAALLRSGRQAQAACGEGVASINLSSQRVAEAVRLLAGVQRDQPLGVMLGTRFERLLRDTELSEYILPVRRVAPLQRVAAEEDATDPQAVAIRDVCDGCALAKQYRREPERSKLWRMLADAAKTTPGQIAQKLGPALQDLSAMLDAVEDLVLAESLYQTAQGNPERAGAALGVIDQQAVSSPLQFAETPRTGHTYTQRMVVLTPELLPGPDTASHAILKSWSASATDLLSRAEPRLSAWVAQLIGDPDRLTFTVSIRRPRTPEVTHPVSIRNLGLSPLRLITAAQRRSGQMSELQERLLAAVGPLATGEQRELDRGRANDHGISLAALETHLRLVGALLEKIRPLSPSDFEQPGVLSTTQLDGDELQLRAAAIAGQMTDLATLFRNALGQQRPEPARVRSCLQAADTAGVAGAWPLAADTDARRSQAERILQDLEARLRESEAARLLAETAPDRDKADLQVKRLRSLIGPAIPLLSLMTSETGWGGLRQSLTTQETFIGTDPCQMNFWLSRMGHVRPDLDRLAGVLTACGLLGEKPSVGQLAVAQVPFSAGQRWLALEAQNELDRQATLAIVFHSFAPAANILDAGDVAGFVVDSWYETIPAAQETRAVAFQYSAPSARPPQAILIATPRATMGGRWSVTDLEAVVNEALDLAKMRMIRPQDVPLHGLWLPALYVPQVITKAEQPLLIEAIAASLATDATPPVIGKMTP